MQAFYRQHLTQRHRQSQAPGWLLRGQREEMGWEFQGLTPEILSPHLGNFSPAKVARRVFITKGFRATPTPGEVTGVQEERPVLVPPPLGILIKK